MANSERKRRAGDRSTGTAAWDENRSGPSGGASTNRRAGGSGLPPSVPYGRRRTDRIAVQLSPIGVLSRVIGDAGIAFLSVVVALALASLRVRGDSDWVSAFALQIYPNGMILAAVFVAAVTVANTLFGVYSRQRTYPMRTKMLRLSQSAMVAGAAAGVVFLLLPVELSVSRLAFLGAWVLAALLMPTARWWSWAYRLDAQARQIRTDLPSDPVPFARRAGDPGKVLVVGGAGYIGSALLPRLLDSGHQVRLLDVFMYGKKPIEPFLEHPNLEVIEADYRQIDQLVQAMQGVKTVVHLGGLVGDPACAWNEPLTIEVNLTFTRVIAEVAKASGVGRFVFASTCSVYGASDHVLDEESDLHPVSLYARSKIASEKVLNKLHGPGFAVTILRFGTIYGISGRTRFDLVVNLLTAKAFIDKGITVFGGDQWRPFVHVSDAAKAVAMVVDAPKELVAGRTYNVGSDEGNATLGDVGRLINQIVPDAEYVDSGRDGDRRNYRVSFRRIREELGFAPDWNLADGVRQVLAALRSGEVADYRAPEYSNVAFLTGMSEASTYLTTESDQARVLITESGDQAARTPDTARAGGLGPLPARPHASESPAPVLASSSTHPKVTS